MLGQGAVGEFALGEGRLDTGVNIFVPLHTVAVEERKPLVNAIVVGARQDTVAQHRAPVINTGVRIEAPLHTTAAENRAPRIRSGGAVISVRHSTAAQHRTPIVNTGGSVLPQGYDVVAEVMSPVVNTGVRFEWPLQSTGIEFFVTDINARRRRVHAQMVCS